MSLFDKGIKILLKKDCIDSEIKISTNFRIKNSISSLSPHDTRKTSKIELIMLVIMEVS